MAGEFCWSITVTDVHTQWTETRAVSNRGQAVVAVRIAEIEASLPFPILDFDTDNGGEFLNWHLLSYFGKKTRPVPFTRSRAYRKKRQRARGTKQLDSCAATGRLQKTARRASGRAA
jgi:hypothetical protein